VRAVIERYHGLSELLDAAATPSTSPGPSDVENVTCRRGDTTVEDTSVTPLGEGSDYPATERG
jgi:hypothetical protein